MFILNANQLLLLPCGVLCLTLLIALFLWLCGQACGSAMHAIQFWGCIVWRLSNALYVGVLLQKVVPCVLQIPTCVVSVPDKGCEETNQSGFGSCVPGCCTALLLATASATIND
jgi:hypothetical protein